LETSLPDGMAGRLQLLGEEGVEELLARTIEV
jgi:hypothetical protein